MVQEDPEAALEDYLAEEGLGSFVPTTGYRVERAERGRVLMSWDADGRTRVAVVLSDAIGDVDGREGWGVEVWATCDLVDLPEEIAERLGIGIWTDRSGRRVPASECPRRPAPRTATCTTTAF